MNNSKISFGFFCVLFSGCATLVNGERQSVFIRGGVENAVTKLQTPDGNFDIDGGAKAILLTRSRSDIPVTIICPDGKKSNTIMDTRFDWLWGGAGNFLNGGLGWFVDPLMNDAYVIEDFSLMGFCKSEETKK